MSAPAGTADTRVELELTPEDNARLAVLRGPLDQNLRLIEQRLGVEVRGRGNRFVVVGGRAGAGAQVLRDLFELAGTDAGVDLPDVHLALREHEDGGDLPTQRATGALPPGGHGGGDGVARVPRGVIRARGPHQKHYINNIQTHDLTFGVGPAGTGKTYLAVACAVEALQTERVRRLVLVRPAVEAGERLGFLPGDLSQKVDPYLRPMYDALYEMLGFDRVARLIERNVIEVAPLAFMRGRSLNESFIIMDEAQNTTPEQMKMFLTRIGFGSHAVVTGDVTQTDLPFGKPSGLRHVLNFLQGVPGVAFSFFDAGDVVRHPLVQRIVQAYEAFDERQEGAAGAGTGPGGPRLQP